MQHLLRRFEKRSLHAKGLMLFSMVSLSSMGKADLSVSDIVSRMKQGENVSGSFTGTAIVTVSRTGVPVPDLNDPAMAEGLLDGRYRWYVRGRDWWTVKEVTASSSSLGSGTNLYVLRNYDDQVLSYTTFQVSEGKRFFLAAHLDKNQQQSSVGPMLGRRWNMGTLSEILSQLTDVSSTENAGDIRIDGRYKGIAAHMTVVPKLGYLATAFSLANKNFRTGFEITKVRQIGHAWLPEEARHYGGDYAGGVLSKGIEAHVQYADFSPHGVPTQEEVPPLPPGATLGSEDNRMYRVAQDGTLIDWGRQGYKPNATLAWGNLFVLSGAGLLLGSLSWIVFRNRRSSPRSPSVSRR